MFVNELNFTEAGELKIDLIRIFVLASVYV